MHIVHMRIASSLDAGQVTACWLRFRCRLIEAAISPLTAMLVARPVLPIVDLALRCCNQVTATSAAMLAGWQDALGIA